jgi:hypothetical protein
MHAERKHWRKQQQSRRPQTTTDNRVANDNRQQGCERPTHRKAQAIEIAVGNRRKSVLQAEGQLQGQVHPKLSKKKMTSSFDEK